jgi:hypothetical protein
LAYGRLQGHRSLLLGISPSQNRPRAVFVYFVLFLPVLNRVFASFVLFLPVLFAVWERISPGQVWKSVNL